MFSVVMLMSSDLQLMQISECVKRHLPDIAVGQDFLDYFDIHRPSGVSHANQIRKHSDSLYLILSRDRTFALRGQIVSLDDDTLVFLGSPWLAWISQNRPDLQLSVKDFSVQDSQLDQQFFIASNQTMVKDLESINTKLQQARDLADMANRAKTDFLGLMSHEMRTPLNGVVASLTLLQDQLIDTNQLALIDTAQRSSADLLSVINYVLSYANLELGNTKISEAPFNCHELLLSLADVLRGHATDKELNLNCNIDSHVPPWLTGDGEKLTHIVTNFITNAIKYTDQGEVSIHLSATGISDNQTQLRVDVRDTGCGIPKDKLDRVFESVWASESRVASEETSVGIGLDICQQLTNMLGGQIGCDSEPGAGCCFWITAPFTVLNQAPVQQTRSLPSTTTTDSAQFTGRVLVADDSHVNLMLTEMMLHNLGVQVQTVSNGREAVERIEQVPFDLVLMDISMPVMDGIEATKLIRQMTDRSATPIVAQTAHNLAGDRERFLKEGMDDFLAKPIAKHDLVCVLAQYLSLSDPNEAESADDDHPICDQSIVQSLCNEIGGANLDKVISMFEKEAESSLPRIIELSNKQEWSQVAKRAHALSSSARSFGATRLGLTLKKIEHSIKSGDTQSPPQSIMTLHDLYAESMTQLRQITQVLSKV